MESPAQQCADTFPVHVNIFTSLHKYKATGRLLHSIAHLAHFISGTDYVRASISSCKATEKYVLSSPAARPAIYTVPMADATKIQPLNRDEEAFLRALGRVMALLPRLVDADMLEEHSISSTEYTVLFQLSEVPHNQMRMSELANVCGLSLSGMTRVVNRLESQSLVIRQKAPDDGRALLAVLTSAGWTLLKQSWPTNLASVRRHIFSRLEGCDIAAAAEVLQRIAPDS